MFITRRHMPEYVLVCILILSHQHHSQAKEHIYCVTVHNLDSKLGLIMTCGVVSRDTRAGYPQCCTSCTTTVYYDVLSCNHWTSPLVCALSALGPRCSLWWRVMINHGDPFCHLIPNLNLPWRIDMESLQHIIDIRPYNSNYALSLMGEWLKLLSRRNIICFAIFVLTEVVNYEEFT